MTGDLPQRIERIEMRNKALLGVLIVQGAMLLVILCYGFGKHWFSNQLDRRTANSTNVDTLVARTIQVVGNHGKNSVTLSASDDGWAVLSFRDIDGVQRAALLLTPSGKPSLNFLSETASRLSVGVVDAATGRGEEFSLQLKDMDSNVIWGPNVVNPF